MAVVAAVKFDDLVAPGEPPGKADAGHGSLGAAVDHANLFDARDPIADEGGHFHLERIRNAEADTAAGGGTDGLDDDARGVAEDGGPPGANIVDILIAIDIPNAGALGALNEKGFAADAAKGADGGIDAAWDE